MMTRTILRPALLAGLALAVALGGCDASSRQRRTPTDFTSLAQQQGEARQAALGAAETAARADAARERGRTAEADKLAGQAVEQYRAALSISGDMPEAWNNMGIQLMHLKDYLAASEAFTFAMQQSPTDPRPCENLGIVYDRTGWSEESLKYFDMALDRSPNYLPALRGAIKAAHLLSEASEKRLEQVRRALMIETDPAMRDFFEREQLRISGRLDQDAQRRPSRR
jgi:Tfp pilus assembly protein PilF